MKKYQVIIIISILLIATNSQAQPESWYQKKWCQEHGGKAEVVLPDKTRCDCLTATHAIEFDFGPKWEESIGQSLYYAIQTNKKAGIVLIFRSKNDYKYWIRLNTVIKNFKLPIDVWQYNISDTTPKKKAPKTP